MKKRSYKITFDLKEGYAEKARVHTIKFAGDIITKWMEGQLKNNQPIVTGFLEEGILFFPKPDNEQKVIVTPSAVFTGELSSPEDMKRTNKEVKQTLESLAQALKQGLKQESVFIIYRDVNWCV